MNHAERPYNSIESYGIIGDLETVALVGRDGSIDFMCYPYFDSPTIFAGMLDNEKGGYFQIHPESGHFHTRQMYLPETNILMTRFLGDEGVSELIDFMHITETCSDNVLVRSVKSVKGVSHYRLICAPRFNYSMAPHTAELSETTEGRYSVLFTCVGSKQPDLRLTSSVPLKIVDNDVIADFSLATEELAYFFLESARDVLESPTSAKNYESTAFKDTMSYWHHWIAKSKYRGRWRETIDRSALMLKLLTSRRYGSIVASPTFSLPEEIGGVRNWDYRYTWIRDSSFTTYALMRLGFTDEAQAFIGWLEKRCNEPNRHPGGIQLMYAINGRAELTERILTHLKGYKNSGPVRIGNAAFDQSQFDIYGELMDSVYIYDKLNGPVNFDFWQNLTQIINWVCENWRLPDRSIWEIRGEDREFLYTRLMNWVAIDRAFRLAVNRSLPAPLDKWQNARSEIYYDIFKNFWSDKKQSFVQSKGSEALDASCLIMPLMRIIGPKDPRWLSTLAAIERELVTDSLVFRYLPPDVEMLDKHEINTFDGIMGNEGSFCMCTFWYVECLSRAGRLTQARFLFEKMLGYANHLGLYAEELGPKGEHLGNFPQAFTHLSLISAAYDLDRRLDEAGHPK